VVYERFCVECFGMVMRYGVLLAYNMKILGNMTSGGDVGEM